MANCAAPPILDQETPFEEWRKCVDVWMLATTVPKARMAATLIMAMKGTARNVAMNLDLEDIKSTDGVEKLITELQVVFEEDATQNTFSSIERFEKYSRAPEQSMKDYVSEFSDRYRDLRKRLNCTELYSTEILAYRILQQANLSEEQKRLIKATCVEIKFDTMVSQLKKAFGDGAPPIDKPVSVKKEPEDEPKTEVMLVNRSRPRNPCRLCDGLHLEKDCWVQDAECYQCGQTGHLARRCPQKRNSQRGNNRSQSHNPRRNQDEVWELEEELYLTLAEEAGIRGVLDTGASSTVCGRDWLRRFEEFNDVRVERREGSKTFRFGDGESIKSVFVCQLRVFVCGKQISFECHVLDLNIPLLLGRETLKTWRAVIDFATDRIEIDGKYDTIHLTSTGHNVIDLSFVYPDQLLVMSHHTPAHIAKKLHRYFAHGSRKKTQDLIRRSSHPEKDAIIKELDNLDCEECQRLARSKPKRKVAMTLGTKFNEVVCMDLKLLHFADGKSSWVCHMICSLTRFSVMVPVKNKTGEEILEKIFTHWISVFGRPDKFLTDNGGEFCNEVFLEMASRLDVVCHVTPAESPTCNGIVERHNAILGNMVIKTKNDTGCTIATACSWATNAKNCLANHYGFSPHQLVFGSNPSIPSVLTDNHLPAHDGGDFESQLVEDHLTARRVAREKFLQTEANYKLQRVIKHGGPFQDKTKYISGDLVFYKREASKSWLGPATVIGSMDNQVLVKHGGVLYRVHPCKLQLKERAAEPNDEFEEEDDKDPTEDRGEDPTEDRGEDPTGEDSSKTEDPVSGPTDSNQAKKKQKDPVTRNYPLRTRGGGQAAAEVNPSDDTEEAAEESLVMIQDEEAEHIFLESVDKKEMQTAKTKEIEKLKEFEVFEEVADFGEQKISTRWVFTRKPDGELKARLVARGFEENLRGATDSPTVTKFAIRVLLSLATKPDWQLKTIDVKSAFLQSKEIERDVFIQPPKDQRKPGKIWKLKKSLYGLGDASRCWYFTLSTALKGVCKLSRIDKTTFYACQDGNPIGMITVHVDDLLIGGTEDFFAKVTPAITMFKLGKIESGSFIYLGWEIHEGDQEITLSQQRYAKITREDVMRKLQMTPMPRANEELTDEQEEVVRSCVGKLSWLATQTMPEMTFNLLDITTKKSRTGADVKALFKLARSMNPSSIVFRNIHWDEAVLHVYTDASLGNLDQSKSGAGHVIFIESGTTRNLVSYQCKTVKRVVKSVFAAELYSVSEGVSEAILIRHFLAEIVDKLMPITVWTDSRQVFDAVTKISSQPRDKRTILELREIQDHVENDIVEVQWIPSKDNPADILTKKGVSPEVLQTFLK